MPGLSPKELGEWESTAKIGLHVSAVVDPMIKQMKKLATRVKNTTKAMGDSFKEFVKTVKTEVEGMIKLYDAVGTTISVQIPQAVKTQLESQGQAIMMMREQIANSLASIKEDVHKYVGTASTTMVAGTKASYELAWAYRELGRAARGEFIEQMRVQTQLLTESIKEEIKEEYRLKKIRDENMEALRKGRTKIQDYGRAVEKAGFRIAYLGRTMERMGFRLLAISGIIIGVIKQIVDRAADFQQAMMNLNIAMDLSGRYADNLDQAFGQVSENILQLADEWNIRLGDAAKAALQLEMQGIDTAESLEYLNIVMMFAKANTIEAAEASNILLNAMHQFNLEMTDAAYIADLLTKANYLTGASMSELSTGFAYASQKAMKFGLTAEEVIAMMVMLQRQGMNVSTAGRRLDEFFSRLIDKSWDMGISIYDASGNFADFSYILDQLRERVQGYSTDLEKQLLIQDLFGNQSEWVLNILIAWDKEFENIRGSLEDVGGTAEDVANMQMRTFNDRIADLMNLIDMVAVEIGSALLPAIEDGIGNLKELLEDPEFQKFLKDLATSFIESVIPAVISLAEAFQEMVTAMGGAEAFGRLLAELVKLTPLLLGLGMALQAIGAAMATIGAAAPLMGAATAAFGALGGSLGGAGVVTAGALEAELGVAVGGLAGMGTAASAALAIGAAGAGALVGGVAGRIAMDWVAALQGRDVDWAKQMEEADVATGGRLTTVGGPGAEWIAGQQEGGSPEWPRGTSMVINVTVQGSVSDPRKTGSDIAAAIAEELRTKGLPFR